MRSNAKVEATNNWRAGVGRVVTTPDTSICMWGYTGTRFSEGHACDLLVQALAIEDCDGNRAVIVTLDLAGFEREMIEPVIADIERLHGLRRDQVLFNASHTHTGPLVTHVRRPIELMYDLDSAQKRAVENYTALLQDNVVDAVSRAIESLSPARISFHRGSADFAFSRRLPTKDGIQMAPNPEGPADHTVTALKIADNAGDVRAILFGYACHPTTLGSDFKQLTGDYPGFARLALESSFPTATAFFLQGCGSDCAPANRGTMEVVQRNADTLAKAVASAINDPGTELTGRLCSAYCEVELPFAPLPSLDEFKRRLDDDRDYVRKHATHMLSRMKRGDDLPGHQSLPLQVIRMGDELEIIAIGGEPVVEYALRLKRELGEARTWVAGYSNDITVYIPSRRVLEEGGFEPYRSMLLVGAPGPFSSNVEEIVVGKAHELLAIARE